MCDKNKSIKNRIKIKFNPIKILKTYLPEQLTSEELEKILNEVFDKVKPTSAKDMGAIMKEVTPLVKGKADMKEVSNLIKEKINNL